MKNEEVELATGGQTLIMVKIQRGIFFEKFLLTPLFVITIDAT